MMDRIRRQIEGLAADERGTSLTEFAICTPIFVMILGFVYHVGAAGWVLTDQSAKARQGLWEEVVIPAQDRQNIPSTYNDPSQRNAHPPRAAEADEEHLENHGIPQKRESFAGEIREHEEETYQALSSGGHWGESARRPEPFDAEWNLQGRAAQRTADPGDVVGSSTYARGLVDDTVAAPPVDMGAGEPSVMNGSDVFFGSAVSGNARMPVLGAGMRYGVDHFVQEGEVELGDRWTFRVKFTREVSIPPRAFRHKPEQRAVRVVRHHLDSHPAYDGLLGIEMNDRLPEQSIPPVPEW